MGWNYRLVRTGMAGLWLFQEPGMHNLSATSGKSWAGRGNIKASCCPKALEQFQSWRKKSFSSVPPFPSLVIFFFPFNEVTVWICGCLYKTYSLQSHLCKMVASNLPQSIALFEHWKFPVRSMKNAVKLYWSERTDKWFCYAMLLYK